MANVQAPFGLRFFRTSNGSAANAQVTMYHIPSTDNNAYYLGDVVKSAGNADAAGIPDVTKITNGTDTPRGFIESVVTPIGGLSMVGGSIDRTQVSIPASKTKDYYVLVCDDPEALFYVQGDGTATNQTAVKSGYNCSLTITAPSPATYPYSASCVSSASMNTTSSLIIRLIGLAQLPGNGFGAYATWVGKFNQHELMGNQTAI